MKEMKRTQKKRTLWVAAAAVFAFLAAGCEEPADPGPVGSLIIIGIPETYRGANHKLYVSASNSMDYKERHEAQGTITSLTESVTVPLFSPPSNWNTNPDPDIQTGGAWTGTAKYFSVTICKTTIDALSDIHFGVGLGLNDSKQSVSWAALAGMSGAMATDQKTAIFNKIIRKDDAITVNSPPQDTSYHWE
jgi:hypothetical protein